MPNYLGIFVPRTRNDKFTFCLLNQAMELRALDDGELPEVLAYAAGEETALVAVDAPSGLNTGLMARADLRASFTPPPSAGRWNDLRLGEFELVRKRMKVTHTPGTLGACPQWMRAGFMLYEQIQELGYERGQDAGKRWLEVQGSAAFHSLLGAALLPEMSMEGRIQRQLLLWRAGLRVPDPMDAFEEVTRHRLERGQFPFRSIYPVEKLQALVVAYTAWLAGNHPQKVREYGRMEEGLITLPGRLIEDG